MNDKWIPINDRLPEPTCRAGTDEFTFVLAVGVMGVGEYMFSTIDGFTKVGMPTGVDYRVTHCMPLPEFPGHE
jgi:hypothetical protein